MDIDVIVASGGNDPEGDGPVGLVGGGFGFSGVGGYSAGSSLGSNSFLGGAQNGGLSGSSLNASDEVTTTYSTNSGHASPSSLPSNFPHHLQQSSSNSNFAAHSLSGHSYQVHQASSLGSASLLSSPNSEKVRSKRSKTSKAPVAVSNATGQQGSMESMMFGWKLSRKVIPPEIQAFTDHVRKRNMIEENNAKLAGPHNNSNSNPNIPFSSPFVSNDNFFRSNPSSPKSSRTSRAHRQQLVGSGSIPPNSQLNQVGQTLPGTYQQFAPQSPHQYFTNPLSPNSANLLAATQPFAHPVMSMMPGSPSGSFGEHSVLMDTTPAYHHPSSLPNVGSLGSVSSLDLSRSPNFGRLTPEISAYDSTHLPGGILPPVHELLANTTVNTQSPRMSFILPSPVPSTASSPRTPTFASSPLAASSLTSSGLIPNLNPVNNFPHAPSAGLPGCNGTSAFQVVAPGGLRSGLSSTNTSAPSTPQPSNEMDVSPSTPTGKTTPTTKKKKKADKN